MHCKQVARSKTCRTGVLEKIWKWKQQGVGLVLSSKMVQDMDSQGLMVKERAIRAYVRLKVVHTLRIHSQLKTAYYKNEINTMLATMCRNI